MECHILGKGSLLFCYTHTRLHTVGLALIVQYPVCCLLSNMQRVALMPFAFLRAYSLFLFLRYVFFCFPLFFSFNENVLRRKQLLRMQIFKTLHKCFHIIFLSFRLVPLSCNSFYKTKWKWMDPQSCHSAFWFTSSKSRHWTIFSSKSQFFWWFMQFFYLQFKKEINLLKLD